LTAAAYGAIKQSVGLEHFYIYFLRLSFGILFTSLWRGGRNPEREKERKMSTQVGNYTLVNFDPSALRVEVGIEPGSDPELRQNEILAFLGDLYKEALTKGETSVRFWLAERIVTGAYVGDYINHANHAAAMVLIAVKSPRHHAKMSDEEWMSMVESYVLKAGEQLHQFRVRFVYVPATIRTFEHGEPDVSD